MRTAALIVVCLIAQEDNRDRPTGAAAKCGSEIAWKTAPEEAAAEAKKAGRLILWYVPTVQGSPMDRKSVVDNYAMMGPWMMRDVVDLVNRKFVPLRMTARGDLAKQCGVTRLEFIEPGFVFLTPELKVVHKVDRVSTWNEDWFADLLRGVLGKAGTYNKPSASTVAARKGDPDAYAEELMRDGELEDALKAAQSSYRKAQILRRQRKGREAADALKSASESARSEAEKSDIACEAGVLALREARYADAVASFDMVKEGKRATEAAYWKGAALHLLNRDVDGVASWKKATEDAASPWAWKAEAELQKLGPFYRCFEELSWLPEQGKDLAATSTLPKKAKDVDFVAKRSVALLLKTQRANGSWNDSNYEFGGKDSLPNVYMAGTALACSALLAWRDVDAKGVDAALERAWPFLNDEKNIANDDDDEIIWAHAYRVQYLLKLAAAEKSKKEEALKKAAEIVGFISKLQKKTGIWQHEYDAPFTTATVLVALWEAKQAGVAVPDEILKRGSGALAECRDGKGVFSYGYPGKGGPVQQSGGRMPMCELALLLCGRSSEAALKAAIEASFEHHGLLEKIRKYDDHADQFRNGGFFFWYDMVGRAEAAKKLKDGAKLLERQRDIALSITEIDGCFVDSHELGKSYGTAMGLLTLKVCEKK